MINNYNNHECPIPLSTAQNIELPGTRLAYRPLHAWVKFKTLDFWGLDEREPYILYTELHGESILYYYLLNLQMKCRVSTGISCDNCWRTGAWVGAGVSERQCPPSEYTCHDYDWQPTIIIVKLTVWLINFVVNAQAN